MNINGDEIREEEFRKYIKEAELFWDTNKMTPSLIVCNKRKSEAAAVEAAAKNKKLCRETLGRSIYMKRTFEASQKTGM